jgi:hypothetical protein
MHARWLSSSRRAHRQPPARSFISLGIIGLVVVFGGAFATLAMRPKTEPKLPLKPLVDRRGSSAQRP